MPIRPFTAPPPVPTLRFGAVYIIFVLLGTGTLLPFNVFLTEKEFYDVRLQVPVIGTAPICPPQSTWPLMPGAWG